MDAISLESLMQSVNLNVENTNSESLLSKLSLVELGYRHDPFLRLMVTSTGKKIRRSPAINRGYLTRIVAIENTFEKILLLLSSIPNQKFQVLSLGAGYDTTYFRIRNCDIIDAERCKYFEVDFPVVSFTKTQTILKRPLLRSFFKKLDSYEKKSCYSFDDGQFGLVGCDMTDIGKLNGLLDLLEFDWNTFTIILTECSTTYVDIQSATNLLKWLTEKLFDFVFIDYEQIRPFDTFGKIMKNHFQKRGSPLQCIDNYPTVEDHRKRFLSLGWSSCSIQTIESCVRNFFGRSENFRMQYLVNDVFDEEVELWLKCTHYILVVGIKLKDHPLVPLCYKSIDEKIAESPISPSILSVQFSYPPSQSISGRFGHSMVSFDNEVLIYGGYSKSSQRRQTLILVDKKTWEISRSFSITSTAGLHSSMAPICHRQAIIFGGRGSPEEPTSQLFHVDVDRNIVQLIENGKGPIPQKRWKHTLTKIEENKLVLIGGKDKVSIFDEIYEYNFLENNWRHVGQFQKGIHCHSAVNFHGKIIVSGGLDPDGRIYSTLFEVANEGKDSQYFIQTLDIVGMIPRFSHTSHVVGSLVFLIGGVSTFQEPSVGIVNLQTRTCREFSYGPNVTLEAPLTFHTSFVEDKESGDVCIRIIGGGTNCFSFGMHINSSIVSLQLDEQFIFH